MFKRRQFINYSALLSAGAIVSACRSKQSSGGSVSVTNEESSTSKESSTGKESSTSKESSTGKKRAAGNAKEFQAAISPGIQLYTLRDALSKSPVSVLESVAQMGYQEVELAGLPANMSAQEFRAVLDDLGLSCPAMHVQGPVDSQAAIAQSVGAELLVLPVPMPLLNNQWQLRADVGLEDFRQFAGTLNQMGAEAKRYELQFGFHNHAWEMVILEDELAYEVLLTETDPELVFMELDLGWAHVGKVDALELFARNPGRFKTCHVKDFDSSGNMVNAGEGIVPLATQLFERDVAGLQHYFIEHDNSKDPMESARLGYQFLSGLAGA